MESINQEYYRYLKTHYLNQIPPLLLWRNLWDWTKTQSYECHFPSTLLGSTLCYSKKFPMLASKLNRLKQWKQADRLASSSNTFKWLRILFWFDLLFLLRGPRSLRWRPLVEDCSLGGQNSRDRKFLPKHRRGFVCAPFGRSFVGDFCF